MLLLSLIVVRFVTVSQTFAFDPHSPIRQIKLALLFPFFKQEGKHSQLNNYPKSQSWDSVHDMNLISLCHQLTSATGKVTAQRAEPGLLTR